jgi:uncharacterized membrane protein YraQ (UPF0718 family)
MTARTNVLFLAGVVLLYLLLGAVDAGRAAAALAFFVATALRILPVLALVFLLVFLTNLLIRPEWISRHLGEGAGLRGWAIAALAGVVSSGPIFLWYPMLADLREQGVRTAFVATFLYARAIKISLIPLMIYYFGVPFTVALTACLAVFSLLAGYLTERTAGPGAAAQPGEGNG